MTPRTDLEPFPRFGDVAHVRHVELFTPRPDASLILDPDWKPRTLQTLETET